MRKILDFFGTFLKTVEGNKVIQTDSRAGGIICKGDMVGGNYHMSGRSKLPDGSYVGGNLEIDNMKTDAKQIAAAGINVKGRVIINGVDVTDEYRNERDTK